MDISFCILYFHLYKHKLFYMLMYQLSFQDACSLEEKLWPTWQCIKKQKHYFVKKGPSSQSYGFSSSHVWKWELDYKEYWAQKNWCCWTVVLEESWESLGQQRDPISPS